MALTLVRGPIDPTLARNEVPLVLESDLFIYYVGSAAISTFDVANAASYGDTVTLIWNGTTVVFTCFNPLDDDGLKFAAGVNALGTAQDLRTVMRSNELVDRDFIVSGSGTEVILTARTKGTVYDVATDSTCSPGSLGTWTLTSGGSNDAQTTNHSVGVRVLVEEVYDSTVYTALPTITLNCGADSKARVDMRGLLSPYLSAHWPAYGATTPTRATKLQRRFQVKAWENAGDPVVGRSVVTHFSGHAWYGGLAPFEMDAIPDFMEAIDSVANKRFLTWRGRSAGLREVTKTEQHWLGWRRYFSVLVPDQWYVQARLRYSDGSVSAWTTRLTTTAGAYKYKDIVLYPTGYTELDLGAIDSPPSGYYTTGYDVRLRNTVDTTNLSEEYHYELVPVDANERHLLFVNSLGCIESLRTRGQWEEGVEVEMEALYRAVGVPDSVPTSVDHAYRSRGTSGQNRVQLSTGPLPRGDVRPLMDILFAPEDGLRLVDHAGARHLPVRLSKAKARTLSMGTEEENLWSLNLELEVGDPTLTFSNMPIA